MLNIELPDEVDLKAVLRIRRYLVLPLITVVTIVGLLVFFVIPTVKKISEVRKEVKFASEELRALEEKVEVLQGLDESYLSEQVEVLEQVLPSTKDVLPIFAALSGLASENEVLLSDYSLSPGSIATEAATPSAKALPQRKTTKKDAAPTRKSELESFPVKIEATGPFDKVVDFISGVENLKPLMKLTSLSISPDKRSFEAFAATGSASIRVKADLVFDIFFVALPKTLGATADPISTLSKSELETLDKLAGLSSYPSTPAAVTTGKEDPFAPF